MADEEEFDQWELADGFGLDDVDVDVLGAEFTINNSLGHSNLALALTLVPRNGEETKIQYFSMGPGWRAVDDGRKAVSEDGNAKKISKQCNLGVFLKSVEKAMDRVAMRELGNPLVSATWQGTAWHVKRESRMVTNPSTGIEKESSSVVATKYLGTTKGKPATTSTKGSSNGKPANGFDTGLLAKLTELAKGSENEDAFLTAAAQLEEVRADRTVQKALYGDGFYAALANAS
jgi:hypothetical protein